MLGELSLLGRWGRAVSTEACGSQGTRRPVCAQGDSMQTGACPSALSFPASRGGRQHSGGLPPHAAQDELSMRETRGLCLGRCGCWWRWPEGDPGNLPGHRSTSPPGRRPWRLVHTPSKSHPVSAAAAGTHTMYQDSHLGRPSPEGPDLSRTRGREDAGGKNHLPEETTQRTCRFSLTTDVPIS